MAKRISEVTLYEVYFDLWGMTSGWIDAISNKLLDFANPREETCEAYANPACMAVRFRTPSKERARKAKAIFVRMENLAKQSTVPLA